LSGRRFVLAAAVALLRAGQIEPFLLEPLPLEVVAIFAARLAEQRAEQQRQRIRVRALADLENHFCHLGGRCRHMLGDEGGIAVLPAGGGEIDGFRGSLSVNRDPPVAQGVGKHGARKGNRLRDR